MYREIFLFFFFQISTESVEVVKKKKKAVAHITIFCFFSLRLMVNLTQPAMLCFGKVPDNPVFRHHFLEVTAHLQAYKEVLGSQ